MKKDKNVIDLNIQVILLLLGLIVIFISIFYGIAALVTQSTFNFTVTDKTVKNTNNDGAYLIYGVLSDGSTWVVKNTDEFFYGKFNSSDVYAELKIGETYEFKVIGFRIPFLSQYQNLIEYQLLDN